MKPYVPKRIHEWNADMKLIFILRDPVERAISDYAQAVSNKQNEQRSFEKLIFKKRKKGGAPGRSNEINPKSSKVKYLIISSRKSPPPTGFLNIFQRSTKLVCVWLSKHNRFTNRKGSNKKRLAREHITNFKVFF